MPRIQKIDHFVITSAVAEESVAFYRALGFDVVQGDGRYELFAGDFKINIHIKGQELSPRAQHVQIGSADICFEIDGSLEVFKQEFESRGLCTETGIVVRHGVRGEMRSVYLRDPDGNLVEFCAYVK